MTQFNIIQLPVFFQKFKSEEAIKEAVKGNPQYQWMLILSKKNFEDTYNKSIKEFFSGVDGVDETIESALLFVEELEKEGRVITIDEQLIEMNEKYNLAMEIIAEMEEKLKVDGRRTEERKEDNEEKRNRIEEKKEVDEKKRRRIGEKKKVDEKKRRRISEKKDSHKKFK